MRPTRQTPKRVRRRVAFLAVALTASSAAALDEAQRIKLRDAVAVCGSTVTLGDVLDLGRADAELGARLAGEPVVTLPAGQVRTVITHDRVVARLEALGVNLAHVLVGGAWRCTVTVRQPTEAHGNTGDRDAGRASRPHQTEAAPAGTTTLADVIRAFVDAELAEQDATALITFERAGEEFLGLTTPPWDFRVSSSGRDVLGLREFRVLVRRDGRLQRTLHLYAQVRMVKSVVVAKRPLSIGNFIRPEDVTREERIFGPGETVGVGAVAEAIGQQVKAYVPPGGMVAAGDLKSMDLVRRSRPVTVMNNGGGVKLRLTGIALDSGTYGDDVRVRLGERRDRRQIVRGVVTGLGTVRLAEGNS